MRCEYLSDQAPISYQKLYDDYRNYKFVGLCATGSMADELYDPIWNLFSEVSAESFSQMRSQFPCVVEGMTEASIQLLSVEVQAPLLNQTRQLGYCVYCYCKGVPGSFHLEWQGGKDL